jgi:hypothetical protein
LEEGIIQAWSVEVLAAAVGGVIRGSCLVMGV